MSAWIECGTHRDYPTIELRIRSELDDATPRRRMLFDTGSRSTYLADFLFPAHLRTAIEGDDPWDLDEVQWPTRAGGLVLTKTLKVPVEISDGDVHVAGEARVKYVARWDETQFARCGLRALCSSGEARCDDRVGLVSTRLLSDLDVEIALHGPRRTLSIRRDAPTRPKPRAKRG